MKMRDIVAYADLQHKIVKAALVEPTYDDIMEKLGGQADLQSRKNVLDELKKKLEFTPRGTQRSVLEEEIESARIWIDLILPEDFIGYIVAEATGVNQSEIRNISEEMLIDAAALAEKGSKRPSEIIAADGFWTPFMLADIDKRAWLALYDYRENHKKTEKQPRMKIGGR